LVVDMSDKIVCVCVCVCVCFLIHSLFLVFHLNGSASFQAPDLSLVSVRVRDPHKLCMDKTSPLVHISIHHLPIQFNMQLPHLLGLHNKSPLPLSHSFTVSL
jgi:hypothetical protein